MKRKRCSSEQIIAILKAHEGRFGTQNERMHD